MAGVAVSIKLLCPSCSRRWRQVPRRPGGIAGRSRALVRNRGSKAPILSGVQRLRLRVIHNRNVRRRSIDTDSISLLYDMGPGLLVDFLAQHHRRVTV